MRVVVVRAAHAGAVHNLKDFASPPHIPQCAIYHPRVHPGGRWCRRDNCQPTERSETRRVAVVDVQPHGGDRARLEALCKEIG
jgi:hypothetical protein